MTFNLDAYTDMTDDEFEQRLIELETRFLELMMTKLTPDEQQQFLDEVSLKGWQ